MTVPAQSSLGRPQRCEPWWGTPYRRPTTTLLCCMRPRASWRGGLWPRACSCALWRALPRVRMSFLFPHTFETQHLPDAGLPSGQPLQAWGRLAVWVCVRVKRRVHGTAVPHWEHFMGSFAFFFVHCVTVFTFYFILGSRVGIPTSMLILLPDQAAPLVLAPATHILTSPACDQRKASLFCMAHPVSH